MANQTVQKETLEQALCRLAEKAREFDVQLKRDRADGRYYASSVSQPGTWHYVTGYSCDCMGFARHHRCMHYAALLAALGWLPQPEPARPVAKVTCLRCWGAGMVGEEDRWCGECPQCHGTGTVEPKPAA